MISTAGEMTDMVSFARSVIGTFRASGHRTLVFRCLQQCNIIAVTT